VAVTLKVTLVVGWPGAVATVMFDGHVIIGGWVSVTTTVCTQVAVLPLASRTVQVTVLVPTGKLAGASLVMVTAPPQLSIATRFPKLTLVAAQVPAFAATVTCAGQVVIAGGSVSVTTTVCAQVVVLPLASRTVQVTVLVPSGKLAGASLVMV